MTLQEEYELSCYQPIAELSAQHGVSLVQHKTSGKIYVKKRLTQYNLSVFRYLREHPVPNIPRIYTLIEDSGTLIVIEEYLSGRTLQELLDEQGVFSETQVIDLMLQLCSIVDQLHQATPAIVHRDIKPSNIILSPDGTVKLLDMNAARQFDEQKTEDTTLLGTVGYAAPEQFGFATSSVQTDIYAIGVLMNVLLTEQLPKDRLTSGKLRGVILQCTKLEPQERYRSVAALASALRALAGRPVSNSAGQGWRRFLPPGFRSMRPLYVILAVIGYGLLLDFGLTATVQSSTSAVETWFYRIATTLALLSVVFFSGNYLDVQSRFPLTRSENRGLRILGILLADAVLFFAVIAVGAILAAILFPSNAV